MDKKEFVPLSMDDIQPIYDSPIAMAYGNALARWIDNKIFHEAFHVTQKLKIDVDRKKLEQALLQDKARYEDAYRKGYMAGWQKGWNDAKEVDDGEN